MKKNVYVRTGLTVFCTVAAILLFYDTFLQAVYCCGSAGSSSPP